MTDLLHNPGFCAILSKKGGTHMADLETLRKHLGQNLRRARAQAGLSQREVAQHLGVSRPTYTYYETGHTAPSVFDLYRLAQLYGCPMEDFLK